MYRLYLMTNEIQELKNSLFSHYLLQDHDENSKKSKGVIHSSSKFVLDGTNILGHRHPLYLRSLVDCFEHPSELTQEEAINFLSPTIDYAKSRLSINHPHLAVMNSSDANLFWRQWDFQADISNTVRVPLCFNTSLLFSLEPIIKPSRYFSTLSLVYQNHITKLFKEQNFLEENGRVHLLSNLIKEHANKLGLKTQGLSCQLPYNKGQELSHNFMYLNTNDQPQLIFPVNITNSQVELIFQKLKEVI